MVLGEYCLIDTNVLIYSTVSGNPWHQEARNWLSSLSKAGVMLCVTPQVLREYLVVLTRGTIFETQFTTAQVITVVDTLLKSLEVLDETAEVAAKLRELLERYPVRGKRIHDANIVATMLTYGVTRLATYNCDDFSVFRDLLTLEPLP